MTDTIIFGTPGPWEHIVINLEDKMIDKDKEYRTKAGREVRIYATGNGGEYPVHGATAMNNIWYATTWSEEGDLPGCSRKSIGSLVEVKPKKPNSIAYVDKADGHIRSYVNGNSPYSNGWERAPEYDKEPNE